MRKGTITKKAAGLVCKAAKKTALGAVGKKFILSAHDIIVPETVKKYATK